MNDASSASASEATTNPAPGFTDHPGHIIDLEESSVRQRALFGALLLADSAHALVVREANYPPVIYFPRGDVNMDLLQETAHSSYCPFKGDASYWSIAGGEESGENAAWSYLAPYDEMTALKGYIAFYADRVRVGP